MSTKMKIFIFFSVVNSLIANPCLAAVPNWHEVSGMQYNQVAYGNIYMNGSKVDSSGSLIGAFGPGGESDCRGTATIPLNQNISYYLTLVGNTNVEIITFKLYDNNTDTVYDLTETLTFQSDATNASFDFNLTTGGSISGTISYPDWETGSIKVNAFSDAAFSVSIAGAEISSPGNYSIHGLAPGDYYVGAFNDTNNNGVFDRMEPMFNRTTSVSVTSGSDTSVIDLVLSGIHLWDVNGDGKMGLEEAIFILQVIAKTSK